MTRTEARAREGDPLLSTVAKIQILADEDGTKPDTGQWQLSEVDSSDLKELKTTWEQLFEQTVKHCGEDAAHRLLDKHKGRLPNSASVAPKQRLTRRRRAR